jgi:hypothetical protein
MPSQFGSSSSPPSRTVATGPGPGSGGDDADAGDEDTFVLTACGGDAALLVVWLLGRELATGESGVVLAVLDVVVAPNRFSTIESERDRCCTPWYTTVDAEARSSPIVDNRLARTLLCWLEETEASDEADEDEDEDDDDDGEKEEAADLLTVVAVAAVLAGRASTPSCRPPLSSPRPAVRCEAANNPIFGTILLR